MDGLQAGDKVEIVAGRHRGSKGKLVAITEEQAPSGSLYRFAYVERPRAGLTLTFAHEIRKVEP